MGSNKIKTICLIMVMLLLSNYGAKGQGIIIQANPPSGLFTHTDLWNMSVTFTGGLQFPQYSIQINVSNSSGPVCSSSSSDFVPYSNFMILTPANLSSLQPILLSFYNTSIQSVVNSSGGYFPAGIYNVDIVVFGVNYDSPDGQTTIEVASTSYNMDVSFVIPPQLVYVYNHDTINLHDLPGLVFSWTSPYPVSPSSDLRYTIFFKEMLPGQNEYDAMQSNPLLHTEGDLASNTYPYPITAPAFEVGKSYSWNVIASLDGTTMETETWEFTVSESPLDEIDSSYIIYTEPKRRPDGSFYLAVNKIVYLRYYEEYMVPQSKLFNYYLYSNLRALIAGVDELGQVLVSNSPAVSIHKGTNYLALDFSSCTGLNYNTFYYLEIYNEKKELWHLKIYPYAQ